jgi:hypothetical protein
MRPKAIFIVSPFTIKYIAYIHEEKKNLDLLEHRVEHWTTKRI